uniref:Uncharacterized protein n=1 Tax=Anopheles culicifacies TaxID=139723 RepID=A0A182M6L6_9DIPT
MVLLLLVPVPPTAQKEIKKLFQLNYDGVDGAKNSHGDKYRSTFNMKGSKSKTSHFLTAERLQRIIKNVRNASSILNTPERTDVECLDKKCTNEDSSTCNGSQLKISHRKLTADEIDKLMKNLSTTQRSPSGHPAPSFALDSEKQQVEQEAVEPSVTEDQYAESEISFTSYHPSSGAQSGLELPADVEDNLAYSDASFLSFRADDNDQSDRLNVRLNSFPVGAASRPTPLTLFAFRPIELTASEEYESYGETSRSTVDRPIMQVKVRPLPASHSIRSWCLRAQQSDDEQPLIDFRQIERNTKATWKQRKVNWQKAGDVAQEQLCCVKAHNFKTPQTAVI